jgi:mannose-1-phosphate guanylyltransferase
MEKLPKGDVFVVPGDFGWNDVGSWSALSALRPADAHGNSVAGASVTVDARGNIIYAGDKRVVAAVGVHDLVIVATEDAVLVLPKERAQDVREVVKQLEAKDLKTYL